MITRQTTLVLGAGASKPYGFPLGSELRESIIALTRPGDEIAAMSGLAKDELLKPFVFAFNASRLYSIDAFLGIRTEFADIGKRAIAAVLLHAERRSGLGSMQIKSDWYDYLWNKVTSGCSWESLSFDKLSIVTFNYDRSLEIFLIQAMMNTYGVNEQDAITKLDSLRIEHVYGSLGALWMGTERTFIPFGQQWQSSIVEQAAKGLVVIPEARHDAPSFVAAKEVLSNASAIGILGFGFDEQNLMRLDSTHTCSDRPSEAVIRPVVATCYGLTEHERLAATNRCAVGLHTSFINADCLGLLRQTLLLG